VARGPRRHRWNEHADQLATATSARANDSILGSDAYRTHVGMSELKLALAAMLGGLALIGGIIAALVANAR
jgi:hypothetical protein